MQVKKVNIDRCVCTTADLYSGHVPSRNYSLAALMTNCYPAYVPNVFQDLINCCLILTQPIHYI